MIGERVVGIALRRYSHPHGKLPQNQMHGGQLRNANKHKHKVLGRTFPECPPNSRPIVGLFPLNNLNGRRPMMGGGPRGAKKVSEKDVLFPSLYIRAHLLKQKIPF